MEVLRSRVSQEVVFMPIRTVLFEDHEVSRIALRLTLQDRGDFEIVAEADDGFSAVNVFESARPELVITELWLPHMSGLDAIRRMSDLDNAAKILVMSSYQSDENVLRSFIAGASGFCTKEVGKDDLLGAIDQIMAGDLCFDRKSLKRALEACSVYLTQAPLSQAARLFLNGQDCNAVSKESGLQSTELARALRSELDALIRKR